MGKAESKIELYLKKQAEKQGFLCYKFTSGHRGVPDRMVIGNGNVVFAELKSDIGKTTLLQNHTIWQMRDRGAVVHVINSREQVDALIDAMVNNTVDKFTNSVGIDRV